MADEFKSAQGRNRSTRALAADARCGPEAEHIRLAVEELLEAGQIANTLCGHRPVRQGYSVGLARLNAFLMVSRNRAAKLVSWAIQSSDSSEIESGQQLEV